MTQAFPDPVDLHLLSMVMGCDVALLQSTTAELVQAGLAQARMVADGDGSRPEAPSVTDRGMAVGYGMANDGDDAATLLERLEAQTLRALLAERVKGSRLPPMQLQDLRVAIDAVGDRALVDAARVWAHQPVSDWPALLRVLEPHAPGVAARVAAT
ncbi:hypothetical protein [Piscinibacter sp. XHJ-5]|uniref:hypothetical protein n=1 Tax=Piscinibacter sp. XHJ-5 TaxID=3037797 RepID=UPI002453361F|nr:hypothetical protein [Piscinibacter sp. XHJ-5]